MKVYAAFMDLEKEYYDRVDCSTLRYPVCICERVGSCWKKMRHSVEGQKHVCK